MITDVAIVGGGPGGATCGALLKKYAHQLKVDIFEREQFPRDHVGESLLPYISHILAEIGVWDKIEAADFPIKIGATYRWGNSDRLWDFHFLPNGEFHDAPRPGKFEGERAQTSFQVDRSIYDQILLDHAAELGCKVWQNTQVRRVAADGNRIESLELENGETVEAKYFIDATGHSGLLRRALGIQIEEPSSLKNVAFWDYWQDADWAVTLGTGGTRIQVMSLKYGWIWFIPISETRTSIGFVCPAEYLKKSGLTPEVLYLKAIEEEPRISGLVANAEREGTFHTTKDWSFVAEKLAGENWYLIGEAAGFADPILSAGLTLTHSSAREAAYTILALEKGGNRKWLNEEYENRNRRRVYQHIRFADYWYSANGNFTDLKEFTREIARDAGLELTAEEAFQWLATGGFADDLLGAGYYGLYSVAAVHQIVGRLAPTAPVAAFGGYNGFVLDFQGAERCKFPKYENGKITEVPAYRRDGKTLPNFGYTAWLIRGLEYSPRIADAMEYIAKGFAASGAQFTEEAHIWILQCLETLIRDGWVQCKSYKNQPVMAGDVGSNNRSFQTNRDGELPADRRSTNLKD